jgi:hypothetical protein
VCGGTVEGGGPEGEGRVLEVRDEICVLIKESSLHEQHRRHLFLRLSARCIMTRVQAATNSTGSNQTSAPRSGSVRL